MRSLGFSLGATDKGLRMRGTIAARRRREEPVRPYAPTLLSRVPASSWFAASFGDAGTQRARTPSTRRSRPTRTRSSRSRRSRPRSASSSTTSTRCSRGEHALYAGPGAPLSAGLILHPADVERGAATLKALTQAADPAGHHGRRTPPTASRPTIQGFAARWRAVDDAIGIGTDAAVGNAVKDSIVDSDKFKRVLDEDGVDIGSKTLGLAYVDVPEPGQPRERVRRLQGAPQRQEALENLKHVGGVLFWSGRDGDTVTSDVFVEST